MSKNNNLVALDVERVERMFERYPAWPNFICAGTISLKQTRDLLGIDRYECYNAYLDMLEAGAVYGSGSNMYRASPGLREYMQTRQA